MVAGINICIPINVAEVEPAGSGSVTRGSLSAAERWIECVDT